MIKHILVASILSILCCSPSNGPGSNVPEIRNMDRLNPARYRYGFEVLRSLPGQSLNFYDIDNDGSDEIISVNKTPEGESFVIVDEYPMDKSFNQKNFQGRIRALHFYHDFNGDDVEELFLKELLNDRIILHIMDRNGLILESHPLFEKPAYVKSDWDCTICITHMLDLNDDGNKDILMFATTGIAYQPRGVFAYDLKNRNFIWRYDMGGLPNGLKVADIYGDAKPEIIVSTSSTLNYIGIPEPHRSVGGTMDDHSYLIILDLYNGTLINRKEIGSEHTQIRTYVADMSNDGNQELYLTLTSTDHNRMFSLFGRYYPETGKLSEIRSRKSNICVNCIFLDRDKDGREEVLLLWEDGLVELLNHQYETIRSIAFQNAVFDMVHFEELGQKSGSVFMLSGEHRGELFNLFLDTALKITLYQKIHWKRSSIISLDEYSPEKILISIRDTAERGHLAIRMIRQPHYILTWPWDWIASSIVSGMLILGAVLWMMQTRRRDRLRLKTIREVFESHLGPAILFSAGGNLRILNSRAAENFYLDRNQAAGREYADVLIEPCHDSLRDLLDRAFESSVPHLLDDVMITHDGEQREFFIVVRNIQTDSKAEPAKILWGMEVSSLTQANRAVAWASMAQRLAHEIKTPLSTLMLSAQNLQMALEDKPAVLKMSDKYLGRIFGQIKRLQKMTDAFLKFSRIEKPQFEPCDINELITDYLTSIGFRISENITIEKNLSKEIQSVSLDRQQFIIVLQNLIDNSLTAIGNKGILTITTRLVQTLHTRTNMASAAEIEIADTGTGMNPEELRKLFQPFFSKSPGGTGLGLVIVRKIIEDHGGTIRIESERDVGTVAIIQLPLSMH